MPARSVRNFCRNLILGLLLVLTHAVSASAANQYVRAGATGGNNGTDWTNAYTNLPATLTRGDTYYVADGSYGAYVFDDAVSGTTKIFLKKATGADHGTETGWLASYGDGTADWSGWTFSSNYWEIDGQVGAWASDLPGYVQHGFRVLKNTTDTGDVLIRAGTSAAPRSDITLRRVEAAYTNTPRTGTWAKGQDIFAGKATNLILQRVWFHDAGRVCAQLVSAPNGVVEYSVFERNGHAQVAQAYSPSEHSEVVHLLGGDLIFRYNFLRDQRSTGGLIIAGDNASMKVYGNVFAGTGYWTANDSGDSNGILNGNSNYTGLDVLVYNNTFVDIDHGAAVVSVGGSYIRRIVRNNLFYSVKNFSGTALSIGGTRSHNWFFDSGTQSEANIQNGTGDPFVNRASKNYDLAAATDVADTSIGSEFNTDLDGATRGSDGTWDRGAFEFTAGGIPLLNITTTSLPNGQANLAYSQTLAVGGGVSPYTWSLLSGSLPAGLSLSGVGVISGTPTAAESQAFTVRVTDSAGPAATDDQSLTIVVTTLTISTFSPLPDGIKDIAYSQTLAASGGATPYTWNLQSGTLPAGLSLSAGGVLSGTPTSVESQTFTIRVVDNNSVAQTKEFSLTIGQLASQLLNQSLAVRYYFDEAASGSTSTSAFDRSEFLTPMDLTLDYGGGNLGYVGTAQGRGLESTTDAGTQRGDRSISDTDDDVRQLLEAVQKVTVELVLRVDAVAQGGSQSRFFGITDATSDVGRLMLKATGGGTTFLVGWNNVNVGQWPIGFASRQVLHIVIDSTQAAVADRVKVYKNGASVSVTVLNLGITLNNTLAITTGQFLIAMNRPTPFARSFDGVLAYAALYGRAFASADVTNNYNALLVDDDGPSRAGLPAGLPVTDRAPAAFRPSSGPRPTVNERPSR